MTDYRDATIADAALLADLSRRSFTETFGHLYRPEDLHAFVERLNEAGWAGELSNPAYEVRLAYSEGEPAGFAKLGPITLPVTPEVPALELRQLYLLKPYHGLGIADDLMAWLQAQARARGAQELYLSVWSQNERARRFYARYGFIYVGPYAFMVGEQADEDVIMRKTL